MKKMLAMFVVLSLFSSCTPSAPAPTPTANPTPLPTATLVPEPITGTIFWDANGSGLQDETSFILSEFDPQSPPYFFELLADNGTGLGNHIPGDLVTVPEPPIHGIGVCLGDICTETNADGTFILQPDKAQDTYNLKFSDPHADDPARAFRYVNNWNGPVVIESYKINGVTVPEHHLNNTSVIRLDRMSIQSSPMIEIGIMQGFLTLPYLKEDSSLLDLPIRKGESEALARVLGFDHDPRKGKTLDYKGDPIPTSGGWDSHVGWDYGFPKGTYIIASLYGPAEQITNIPGNGSLNILVNHGFSISGGDVRTVYGHLDKYLVRTGESVHTGQVVGLNGNSGAGGWPHLHLDFLYGQINPPEPDDYLPVQIQKDPYGVLEPIEVNTPIERFSSWTVFNIPQFSLVEVIE